MQEILKEVLHKSNLSDRPIKEFAGGQINHTYQIGDEFVVKIQKDLDVLLHQVPLAEACAKAGAKVPKITDSGLINDKEYIVMEKIPGRKLSEDWHTFEQTQKESLIAQIVEQLKLIHSVPFEKYSPQRPLEFDSWKDAMVHYTDFGMIEGKEFDEKTNENLETIKKHFDGHIDLLTNTEPAVLVHNDLHFENVLHEEGEVMGIFDFDFARQAPKEYELWHLIDFFLTPVFFVEEELEHAWKSFEVTDELKLFKKYYPELFPGEHLLDRVRLYFIEDIMGHAAAGHTNRSNQQINFYFKTNWLEEKLGM